MSALDSVKLYYEDLPNNTRKGGKDIIKMSKSSTPKVEAPAKSYNKTRGEHFKDMLIVALVVGIIAFVGGMQFAKGNQAEIDKAVSALQPQAAAQTEAVKK